MNRMQHSTTRVKEMSAYDDDHPQLDQQSIALRVLFDRVCVVFMHHALRVTASCMRLHCADHQSIQSRAMMMEQRRAQQADERYRTGDPPRIAAGVLCDHPTMKRCRTTGWVPLRRANRITATTTNYNGVENENHSYNNSNR
jgi:hypothetical protein